MWRVALVALFMVGLVSAAPYIIIEKRTTISGNGTGNGTSDGNNYTTAISVSGTTTKTLNLARVGMVNLTASWEDLTGASAESDPVFGGNTSLICWANGTNCQPDDAYNASYLTVESDPLYKSNTSLICWSNGTNCQPDDAYNASYITGNNLAGFYNTTNPPSLADISNPGADKVFQMNGFNLSFVWSAPTNAALDIEGLGGFTGDLVHVHQETGNPGVGTDLVHLETTDADVLALNITVGNTRDVAIATNGNITVLGSKVCTANGANCPASSGGFSANQSVNTSSAVSFSGINITATDAALQFNSSGLRWMIQVQDSGANLKFIDVQGSVILALNKDSDTTTAKNLIGAASYAGAIPVSAQGAASQTANLLVAESSAGTDYVVINGTGFLNSSIGTFIDAKNCDTIDTDASGRLACGTDASGSATGKWVNYTLTNQSGQGTTLRNITGLLWRASANTNYTVDCAIYYTSNATTNGIAFAFEDWESTVTGIIYTAQIFGVTATAPNQGTTQAMTTKAVTSTGVTAANTPYSANIRGFIRNGANSVVVTPQFSAEEAANNATILQGSWCKVEATT